MKIGNVSYNPEVLRGMTEQEFVKTHKHVKNASEVFKKIKEDIKSEDAKKAKEVKKADGVG
jgi:hypothetical protein